MSKASIRTTEGKEKKHLLKLPFWAAAPRMPREFLTKSDSCSPKKKKVSSVVDTTGVSQLTNALVNEKFG